MKSFIKAETEKTIQRGYDLFVSGMAIGVDIWAAEAVLELKETYPHIRLEAAIPCLHQERTWPESSQQRYRSIISQADIVHYVSREAYQPYLMIQRDKYMVDNSSLLIACYDGSEGGTKHTYDYALKKGIDIIRIDPKTMTVTKHTNLKQEKHEQLTFF